MINISKSRISAIGAYYPERTLTNQDLEKMVDTTDEWIVRRTGMRERRISRKDEFSSDLAIKAVSNLVDNNDVSVDDVDMIIVSTFTPDHFTPTVSALVQGHFGMKNTGTMDLSAGCTGSVYGLCVADSLITAGHCRKILLIAAETVSKVVDYSERSSCILFGDAAVALLLERTEDKGCIISSYFTSDGIMGHKVTCSNLSRVVNGNMVDKERIFQQEGRALYEYVVKNIPAGMSILLDKAGLGLGDMNWFIPHSANYRMIEGICKRIDYPIERTLVSSEYFGNTSSVTIPLSIWLGVAEKRIKPGDTMLLYGFGGGLTHGGVIINW